MECYTTKAITVRGEYEGYSCAQMGEQVRDYVMQRLMDCYGGEYWNALYAVSQQIFTQAAF